MSLLITVCEFLHLSIRREKIKEKPSKANVLETKLKNSETEIQGLRDGTAKTNQQVTALETTLSTAQEQIKGHDTNKANQDTKNGELDAGIKSAQEEIKILQETKQILI